MLHTVIAEMTLNLSEGCELNCTMHGSDMATVTVGESGAEHELTFDYPSLMDLVEQTTRVLAEMTEAAEREEAEEEAAQEQA